MSTRMPGPMVLAIVRDLRYWPLAPGRLRPVDRVHEGRQVGDELAAPRSCPCPTATWMMPALSTLNSTRPALTSLIARSMSNVIVPALGFGMRPRRPRIFPSLPTRPIDVRRRERDVELEPAGLDLLDQVLARRPRPHRRAGPPGPSRPGAKTATRTTLPVPCGRTTVPRTIWSAWRGSTPEAEVRLDRRVEGDGAGLLDELGRLERRVEACERSTSFAASLYFLPCAMSVPPSCRPGGPGLPLVAGFGVPAVERGRSRGSGASRRPRCPCSEPCPRSGASRLDVVGS